MKISREMLPMKLHFILRYGGSGPMHPFLTVLYRQKGVSDEMIGIMWTATTFSSLLVKATAGMLADYFRAHRTMFLIALIMIGTALSGIYWSPDMTPTPSLTLNMAGVGGPTNNTQDMTPTPGPTLDMAALRSETNNTQDKGNVSVIPDATPFKCHEMMGELHEDGCPTTPPKDKGLPPSELVVRYEFWILFLLNLCQFCGFMVTLDLQDSICFQMLGDKPQNYGLQRMWGTASYGLTAMVSGMLVDWYSKGMAEKDFLPAVIMVIVFLSLDVVVVARLKFSLPEKKLTLSAVSGAFKHPSVLLILLTTMVMGITMGLLFTFLLILVEDVAALWDPNFPHMKLLQGMMVVIQCASELPCFFVSGKVVKKLGYNNSFLVAIISFSIRYFLYSMVTNPWWFLPIELLHGPSFTMAMGPVVYYANSVTTPGTEATMMAIFGSALHCASGLGALAGGWLFYATNGWQTFFIMGVANVVYGVFFVLSTILIKRFCPPNSPSVVDMSQGQGGTTQTKEELTLLEANNVRILPATKHTPEECKQPLNSLPEEEICNAPA